MVIIKPAVGETKSKVLFLMGATWFNKSLFDLDTVEDSFATCLTKEGIETYTFDIVGSKPGNDESFVGKHHNTNIQTAIDIVKEYNIDYVIGYSYGCYVAKKLAEQVDVKGIIFLDPCPLLVSSKLMICSTDRYRFSKSNFEKDIVANGGVVKPKILEDHVNSLTDEDTFTSPAYPVTTTKIDKENFLDQNQIDMILSKTKVLAAFTKNSVETVRAMFPEKNKVFYPDASHWILIEDKRFDFAKDIAKFIST